MEEFPPGLAERVAKSYKCEIASVEDVAVDYRINSKSLWKGSVRVFSLSRVEEPQRLYVFPMRDEYGNKLWLIKKHGPNYPSAEEAVKAAYQESTS